MLRFTDTINFLSKLSAQKAANALKILASFYVSRLTSQPIHWGMPITVAIEPTTHCNLACPECPSGVKSFTRPTGNLDLAAYKKLIDELAANTVYIYFYFQGEPYLHPRFLELVRLASEKKIYSVTSTNAHFLSERRALETVESGLDRIIISMDGTTQEVYEQYRREGSLEKVLQGIRHLVAAKKMLHSKTPHIMLQFIAFRQNEHQIEAVKRLGKELAVDEVKIKTAQIYDYENGSDFMPLNEKYSRYKKLSNGKFAIKSKLSNRCWKLWHSAEITWDGRVVPCCFDKDAQYEMGNAFLSGFTPVWKGEKYITFRARLLKGRKEIDICTNCSEGLKVWE